MALRQPKRDFVFIDETGDPGHRSSHFGCIALHTTDAGLGAVIECFSSLRFYKGMYGELKHLHEDARFRGRLVEMLRALQEGGSVTFTITHLEKSRYTGPHMAEGHGTQFRDFQIRRLLEAHFSHARVASAECELVFDRHSHSPGQLGDFARYLNNNWALPEFVAITAVDSRYVEAVQVADVALRLFGRSVMSQDPDYEDVDLSFVRSWDVSAMSRDWRP